MSSFTTFSPKYRNTKNEAGFCGPWMYQEYVEKQALSMESTPLQVLVLRLASSHAILHWATVPGRRKKQAIYNSNNSSSVRLKLSHIIIAMLHDLK